MFNNSEEREEGEIVTAMYQYEDEKENVLNLEYYKLYLDKC